MKCSTQAALAVGVGYVLGRRRKMRLATMIAIGAATGGLGGLATAALKRGGKFLSSTDIAGALGPQVGEIVGTVRGDLMEAGKAAAMAALSSRIDSLSDTIHDRADILKDPGAAVSGARDTVGRAGDETVGRAGSAVGKLRRRGRPADAEEDLNGDEEGRRNGRSRREQPAARKSTRAESDEVGESEDEYDDYEDDLDESAADEADGIGQEDAEEPAPRRRKTSRAPVARTRRLSIWPGNRVIQRVRPARRWSD
jgi:hypothetical protein